MGAPDVSIKDFIKIKSVFAQLFEKGVYHGTAHIDSDKLQELDTAGQDIISLGDGEIEGLERLRDVQKAAMIMEGEAAFQIIMGVEGQTGIHYYMPVRCMELDALSYSHQCRRKAEEARKENRLKRYSDGVPKGTKIVPVVTLVFYYGSKPWDGPLSIYDMLDLPESKKDWLKQAVPDYRINLMDARHMTAEEIEEFDEDLKAFLMMLQERYDREKLKKVICRYRETWYAISAVKQDNRYREYIDSVSTEEFAGGVNMDTTLDYIEAQGRREGRQEGRREGIELVGELYRLLERDGRTGELEKALRSKKGLTVLLREYSLLDE